MSGLEFKTFLKEKTGKSTKIYNHSKKLQVEINVVFNTQDSELWTLNSVPGVTATATP